MPNSHSSCSGGSSKSHSSSVKKRSRDTDRPIQVIENCCTNAPDHGVGLIRDTKNGSVSDFVAAPVGITNSQGAARFNEDSERAVRAFANHQGNTSEGFYTKDKTVIDVSKLSSLMKQTQQAQKISASPSTSINEISCNDDLQSQNVVDYRLNDVPATVPTSVAPGLASDSAFAPTHIITPALTPTTPIEPMTASTPAHAPVATQHTTNVDSPPLSGAEAWRGVYAELKTRDENMAKEYQEEIDTLLVFAGLFSAVLTAFVIESYQSLQEDYSETSAMLLRHISHQLANSSTPIAVDPPRAFIAQSADVQVNIFWFMSLVLSLVVALFGIFLKQWIRTHLKWTDITPERKALALRQYRHLNLEAWNLDGAMTVLPVMLQVAVILFLCGLLIFLWNINVLVAKVMTVLIATCLILVATVTLLPVFIPACPYKSPLSELLVCLKAYFAHYTLVWYHRVDDAFVRVTAKILRSYSTITSDDPETPSTRIATTSDQGHHLAFLQPVIPPSWREIDQIAMEKLAKNGIPFDLDALVHTSGTTQAEDLLIMVLTCLLVEGRSKPDSISYNIWLPIVRHILDPTNSLGDHLADSQRIRRCVGLLSERMQNWLVDFCKTCFLPRGGRLWEGFRYPSNSPPGSGRTIIAILAGMDLIPRCTLGELAEMMVRVVVHLDRTTCSEQQLEAIIQDFLALFKCVPAASIKHGRHTDLITATVLRYCDSLRYKALRESELRLLDILLQLAIYGVTEEWMVSSLLDFANMLGSGSQPNAGIIIRPSARALVVSARSNPDTFPPRLAHGICRLVEEPFNYDTHISADDWKRILDKFEPLIDDPYWWRWQVEYNGGYSRCG